jgi:hypothetical protein
MNRIKIINCRQCKKDFEVELSKYRRFCTPECRKLNTSLRVRKNQIETWKFEKECIFCGNKFMPVGPRHKLCSRECSFKFNSYEYRVNQQFEHETDSLMLRLRFEIFKRDNFTCVYCGRNVKDDKIKINCDHVRPKSKKGKNVANNLVTSCSDCNGGKGDILLSKKMLPKASKIKS